MIAPTTRTVLLLGAGLPLAAAVALGRAALWPLWVAYLGAVLGAVLWDLLLLLPHKRLVLAWRAPKQIGLGDEGQLVVELRADGGSRRLPVTLRVEVGELVWPIADAALVLGGGGAVATTLPLRPRRRGVVAIDGAYLRYTGPLGLVSCALRRPLREDIAVVPNLEAARAEAARFFEQRTVASGLRTQSYVGEGSEFDALREFVPGFDTRAIDWKASAKHHKLFVRDFRAERNHQLVIAIDTGRLMCEPIAGRPRLDHAIQAGLILSTIGLKAGDRVGWYAFDAQTRLYMPPARGMGSLAMMRTQTAGLTYRTEETNFTLGMVELLTRLRRRTLVVLFTDFMDTVAAELMMRTLEEVVRRHVVCFVSLRDPLLQNLADAPPGSEAALHRAVVAKDFLREREVVLAELARKGVFCIDASVADAPSRLVHRYLEIRRRELV